MAGEAQRFREPNVMSMSCSTVQLAGKALRILLASIGGARLAIELCPCDLDQNTRSKDRDGEANSFISGCGSAW